MSSGKTLRGVVRGFVLTVAIFCLNRAADGRVSEQGFDTASQALQAGNFEEAVTQFSRCAQDAARAGDTSLEARCLMQLATARQFQGAYTGAQTALDAALKVSTPTSDPSEAEIQAARGANFALTRQ